MFLKLALLIITSLYLTSCSNNHGGLKSGDHVETKNPNDYIIIKTGNAESESTEAIINYSLQIFDDNISDYGNSGILYSSTASTSETLILNGNDVNTAYSEYGNSNCKITGLYASTTYFYRAYYQIGETTIYGNIKSFTTSKENEYLKQTVDLGLSVLWGTCNVGAQKPEEFGDYYAWGEIQQKRIYTEENCSTTDRRMSDISNNSTFDAATHKLENGWRIPTAKEMAELIDKCSWEWTSKNGVKGYTVRNNGKLIFIPAADSRYKKTALSYNGDIGCYWTSTPFKDPYEEYEYESWTLQFINNEINITHTDRHIGQTIRPVKDKQ